ncbi:MAG: hypothetical protein PVG83_07530, partial [Acidimicrobiia bacterium]
NKATKLISRPREPESTGTVRLTLGRGQTETTHHALFACGLGMDAEVVRLADADPYGKYRFGSLHYARSALSVGFRDMPSVKPHVRFSAEGHEVTGTTALIQFRDIYTYFGRIALRFDDHPPNPLSVLVMERLRRRHIPRIIARAVGHRDLGELPDFDVWHDVTTLEFDADPAVAVQADGEGLGLANSGVAEWRPDSLLVMTGR